MTEIKLFQSGMVQSKDREFTRLVGGFSEGSPVVTDLQIGELLSYKKGARFVREQIERNKSHFERNVDITRIFKAINYSSKEYLHPF